jgi:hypothetical protein
MERRSLESLVARAMASASFALAMIASACGGCDSGARSCDTTSDCFASEQCIDGRCIVLPEADGGQRLDMGADGTDDMSPADMGDAAGCGADERVLDHACVDCPPGESNEAGDDPSGPDTSCEPILCSADERVLDHACVDCPPGTTNTAGDDASGPDTSCTDACMSIFGTSCEQVTEGYLKASNSGNVDLLGYSISGSGDLLAVGAVQEDSCADGVDPDGGQEDDGCDSAGAVYLFERDTMTHTWSQVAYLKASNSDELDNFGNAVSLSGDRLAVGAYWESSCADGVDPVGGQNDNGCFAAGAVYLFERDASSGDWSQTAYLKASNSETETFFGQSVSLAGDRLAVGSPGEESCADGVDPVDGQIDSSCTSAGAVYLFERDASSGDWSQTNYLKASNSEEFDNFGDSVFVSGPSLAVGATGEDSCADGVEPADGQPNNSCDEAGAVYLFEHEVGSDTWSQSTYLKASNSGEKDLFGWSISMSGDYLAIGATGEDSCADGGGDNPTDGPRDNSCSTAGAVYLFEREGSSGSWSQAAYLKASNSDGRDRFGQSVSQSGEYLAVGARWEDSCAMGVSGVGTEPDNGCENAGAVYLFERGAVSGDWSQIVYLKASNSEDEDWFGHSVFLSSDLLTIGAIQESSCAVGVDAAGGRENNDCDKAGAVYTFRLTLSPRDEPVKYEPHALSRD